MSAKILKLGLILLGVLIIQGCSTNELVLPVDRPVEVVKTKGCTIPHITNCNIQGITYTEVIDELETCIQELFIILNKCKVSENAIK